MVFTSEEREAVGGRFLSPSGDAAEEKRMPVNKHDPSCACAMSMAERQLGAFLSAVTDLYGPEEGRIAAEAWLNELEATNGITGWTLREYRLITIAAAARLATRLAKVGHHATEEMR